MRNTYRLNLACLADRTAVPVQPKPEKPVSPSDAAWESLVEGLTKHSSS
ncbi:hypothetical protein [Oerskovia turbata]|nr:hypothetical protein [Oerskovia turbata]